MKHFFIKSKHWQVFLLFLLIFIVVQVIFTLALAYSENTVLTGFVTGFAAAGSFALLLSWYYFLIRGMNRRILNPDLKIKIKGIWLFIIFPVVYLFLIFLVFPTGFVLSTTENPNSISLLWMLLIFPIHMFAAFCFYYILYLAAKTIKMAYVQRKVSFVEFAGEFFLLWFFPIGIWFLQPEINKIAEQKTS